MNGCWLYKFTVWQKSDEIITPSIERGTQNASIIIWTFSNLSRVYDERANRYRCLWLNLLPNFQRIGRVSKEGSVDGNPGLSFSSGSKWRFALHWARYCGNGYQSLEQTGMGLDLFKQSQIRVRTSICEIFLNTAINPTSVLCTPNMFYFFVLFLHILKITWWLICSFVFVPFINSNWILRLFERNGFKSIMTIF